MQENIHFKIPKESKSYKENSKLVIDRIIKILDEMQYKMKKIIKNEQKFLQILTNIKENYIIQLAD